MDCTVFDLPDAEVSYYPSFFGDGESERFMSVLRTGISWKQDRLKIYGQDIRTPRLTAWYGDEGKSYSYSGIEKHPLPWTAELLEIKEQIQSLSNTTFNSVLLNCYRNGKDSVSWHSDAEPELGENPIIGSVSFGETRRFHLRHKRDKSLKRSLDLTNGSFLLMRGATQHHWQHQVPKTTRTIGERINLTFRVVH